MFDRIGQLFEHHAMVVMGVVNVTPDSFSDGGSFGGRAEAVAHALGLMEAGADLVDIGGESTRPGSTGVDRETELGRVLPVLEELLRRRPEAIVSVDTSKAAVAREALGAGATMINDVTAGTDPDMFATVAEARAAMVLMHMRGRPRTMQQNTTYGDVVEEVREFLLSRAAAAQQQGVEAGALVLDPGIGFGKSVEGNLELLRGVPRLASGGYPLLVGTSRKSFLGRLTEAPVDQRLGATLATLVPTLTLDRVVVRVHDVQEVVRFRTVLEALGLTRAGKTGEPQGTPNG